MNSLEYFIKKTKDILAPLSKSIKVFAYSNVRRFSSPELPVHPEGKVLLHLGCGEVKGEFYINVDLKVAPHIHFVNDVSDLSIFKDNYSDLIYACHVLEHFSPVRMNKILLEWRRVLKPGGTLRLSVPDFDKLFNVYVASGNNVESIVYPLVGMEDGYATHLAIFNYSFLVDILSKAGFKNIRLWNPETASNYDFEDWASRSIECNGKSYNISLNVEADK